ncbi:hypothetical protein EW145_g4414 [Phellinidium pouzarii]|uniref:Cytochrome P450 n=1 Tax=Phellinidium pouzarii TaxID=167371 RepID=A0A4S4L3J3_9AGAM|nr:hypothetical protein EW145_g4414 [Phellinidium pouzarii]
MWLLVRGKALNTSLILSLGREGIAKLSFTSRLIETHTDENGDIRHEIDIAGATAIATSVLNPGIQKRGQREVDRVLGKDILPTFDDRKNLPYVDAICKECLRWEAITPLGATHNVDVDDYYNGYLIPAGTAIVPNQWAMLRDPKEYSIPEKFMPDRWRSDLEDGYVQENYWQKTLSLLITVASLLATFDFQKATDINGTPITPSGEYDDSLIRGPKPFRCMISPRSNAMSIVVRDAADADVIA